MFEVTMNTINNPFKPELIDSTTIILKQKSPFVQMSYPYDGDFTNLSDEAAIEKVLTDFHSENYKEKIQENNILRLELAFAEQKENFEKKLDEISNQNTMIQAALFELTEEILSNESHIEDEEKPENQIEEQAEELVKKEETSEEQAEIYLKESAEYEEGGADESNEQTDGESDS